MKKTNIILLVILCIGFAFFAKNVFATDDPTPTCMPQTFTAGSVAPSTVRPYDEVVVQCNYGKKLDCMTVTGTGLSNCRYNRYEGTSTYYTCTAGASAGYYNDAACVLSTGTGDACCSATNNAGNFTIIGTDVNYDQEVTLTAGDYTASGTIKSVISSGNGTRISLICNSTTCGSTAKGDALFSLAFPESTDYTTLSKTVTVPAGDYYFRISVGKGSESYIDTVSLANSSGTEQLENGTFASVSTSTVSTSQPTGWGEGDNRVGLYYGSVTTLTSNITSSTVTPTPAPTSTSTSTTSATLALKIKFQGINKKPANSSSIPVKVKVGGGSLSAATAYQTVQFSVNDSGVWSGTASFDSITAGSGYIVYIKGPKHLQKRICEASPTESTAGAYHCSTGAITLAAGTNTLDFSNIILLAGDIPEADGTQNGIVDSYDTTYIRQSLGSTDTTKLAKGDLNLDNIIDTQDYSMVLQTLSIKYDEE